MEVEELQRQKIRSIIQLLEKGYSLRAISVQTGLSRQTVTFYVARLKNAPYSLEALHLAPKMGFIVITPTLHKLNDWYNYEPLFGINATGTNRSCLQSNNVCFP